MEPEGSKSKRNKKKTSKKKHSVDESSGQKKPRSKEGTLARSFPRGKDTSETIYFSFIIARKVESNFDLLMLKDGYEEASGISTPSKEIIANDTAEHYVKAAKNKLLYVVRIPAYGNFLFL